jgi:hypothetical protein
MVIGQRIHYRKAAPIINQPIKAFANGCNALVCASKGNQPDFLQRSNLFAKKGYQGETDCR